MDMCLGVSTLIVAVLLCIWTEHAEGSYARLTGGHGNTTGRVEVSLNGSSWGTVCDDLWTDREAQVVCRQLGFKWGTAYSSAAFGEGDGDIFLDNVQCTGTESHLGDCQHNGWGNNNCRHYEDAGVACYNSSVRLKSRGRTDVGTVEIRANEGWVEVCDKEWDNTDAKVLCKQMGYADGLAQCCSTLGVDKSGTTSDSYPSLSYSNFKCAGREADLTTCSHVKVQTRCSSDHLASAICYKTPVSKVNMTFEVRLGNGTHPSRYWGEVNVRRKGVWGQVCSMGDNWDDIAANIVCQQLNFKGGSAYGTVNETFMPSWIIDMNCTGTEKSLQQCVKGPWGRPVRSCKPAYALCFNDQISVRLVGGGKYYGRVEITHDNHTGSICDKAWSTSDARVVCKQLKFADGDPVTGSYYGKGKGPVMMNGLGCYGYETNIVQCRNKGWMSYSNDPYCKDHDNDASVVCYQNVRLSRGDHSHGVVQIMQDNWSVLCGEGFGNSEARVVCRQLGFEDGMALAMGSFGTFYGKYIRPNITCNGTESSILECNYDKFRACQKDSFLGYAVVSCFNGAVSTEQNMKLEGGGKQTGRVSVQQYGIWGRVCPNSWDDDDAGVVCRQLGFAGGVAYKYTSSGYGPYTLGKVGCLGNESKLFDCPVSSGLCDAQFSSGDAGVLCYNSQKPALRLVGSANSGHLEIILDSFKGTICDFGWSRYDASVACKQLGFQDGEPRSHYPSNGLTVVMSSMGCYGGESSIFMCRNPGWQKNIDDRCFEANRNAGVFCYNHGMEQICVMDYICLLEYGSDHLQEWNKFSSWTVFDSWDIDHTICTCSNSNNENTTAGKVEMYYHGSWVTMCAEGFDDQDARVVCRELGFPNSRALVPGSFGRRYYSEFVKGFNCTGTEMTIAGCQFTSTGECPNRSSNYASVLCSKFPIDNTDIHVLPFTSFPATVIVEKHGMNGTVCADNWDNKDADVLCRQLGYRGGGVAFGPQYSGSSTPIWMTNIDCLGTETRIQNCSFQNKPTSGCLSNHMAARVYCYEGPGFKVRLVGGPSPSEGRVEVSYGGEWGTICDSYWADSDARVVCRQLGFLDGVAQPNSFYGAGSGPSWLYYVRCEGDEKSIWSCTNSGFNVSHTSCRNHKYDASVYCTDKVRLDPNVTYGAVEIWTENGYQLVCADGFDDFAAKVVCRAGGFQHGISVCCSAFGDLDYEIGYQDFKCRGDELSILKCPHRSQNVDCPSGRYASVACSNQPASGDYKLKLYNFNRGSILIKHFDIWGYICADGFDDAEAMVICREKGFQGGFAYMQSRFNSPKNMGIPWLSNINCTGHESYLGKCGNIRWGSVNSCMSDKDPAVYCYEKEGYKFRLAPGNGSNEMAGRVEMSIDGDWGSVCGTTKFDDAAAHVLCSQLGYTSGRALENGLFGEGTGKIMVTYLRCKGNETSLLQCGIKIEPQNALWKDKDKRRPDFALRSAYYTCRTHAQDTAVQCYLKGYKLKLVDGATSSGGRVAVSIDGTWGSICAAYFPNDEVAEVICHSLNYTDGRKIVLDGKPPEGGHTMLIKRLNCVGNETTIMQCSQDIYDTNTSPEHQIILDGFGHGHEAYARIMSQRSRYSTSVCGRRAQVVSVQCYTSVRLSGTNVLNYGILELYSEGRWEAVCDTGFTEVTARVACRQIGYKDGRFQLGSVLGSNKDTDTTIIDMRCNGGEKKLDECQHRRGKCPSGKYVTIYCNESIIEEKPKLDLQIKDGRYYGTLLANKYGFWGPICPTGWSDMMADAACRQLGYMGGKAYNGTDRQGTPMALGKFTCPKGVNLTDCTYKGFNDAVGCQYTVKGYEPRPTAGVLCYNHVEGVQFRLSDTRQKGRVEIMFNGEWGRVCNSSWGDKEASVFCISQGFIDGKAEPMVGRSGGHVWMNYIQCEGTETSILECSNSWTPGSANCDDAGVVCFDSVRVIEGDKASYGAVEVNFNGQWGVVCNEGWDQREVDITCNQLGFQKGMSLCCAPFGYIKSHGNMESLKCTGSESRLTECPHDLPYGSVCSMDYAAVSCYNGTIEPEVKLSVSGSDNATGAVIVNYNGIDGRICADGWDDTDAEVLCGQLGFSSGQAYSHYKWSTGRGDHAPFWTSQVKCKGPERRFEDCPKIPYGQVTECVSKHYAGALCFQKNGVAYRLVSGERNYGRVEVSVDNKWGTLCNRYWDVNDAKVFCRSIGYITGFPLYTGKFVKPPKTVYETNLHCNGSEARLQDCPHEGWESSHKDKNCADHSKDAGVHCYGAVKLGSGVGKSITHGPVLYYNKEEDNWEAICDKGFNDASATLVCQELGFDLGRAISGSAYGLIYEDRLENKTMSCDDDAQTLADCLVDGLCTKGDDYASVACFASDNKEMENEDYTFSILKGDAGDYTGTVSVTHYGLQGRICSDGWDDVDAMVLCRNLTFQHGIATHQLDNEFSPLMGRGPYWMGEVHCQGHEPSLKQCSFRDRLDYKNCSGKANAAVICYNDNGIQYRIVNDNDTSKSWFGRVEISVNNVWGTVCDASWDNNDAAVLCRQKGYHDGYALRGAYFGASKDSPIWLSHLKCTGQEPSLHKCPNRGLNSVTVDGKVGWWKCRSHNDDASVYCINDLKLSEGFNSSLGAVLVYHNNEWHATCDTSFDSRDARVVCRTLGFMDGKLIPGSAFGELSIPIGVTSVHCDGNEKDLNSCAKQYGTSCPSGNYASVYCSYDNIVDTGFHVRIRPDFNKKHASFHGFLEVHIDGVWGSVCVNHWDDKDADVACKQLKYAGGYAYRPPKNITSPLFMDHVQCDGTESSLQQCQHEVWNVTDGCDFYSKRAGVFCYKERGIEFRLGGGEGDRGRVEMKYGGVWGGICDWLWDSRDARVFCRSVSSDYVDGLEVVGARYGHVDGPLWFTRVSCNGNEENILQCRHTGFNSSDEMEGVYAGLCRTRSHDAAARCFKRELEVTDIRLVNSQGESGYGRVEVFLSGANQWGTVCDDYWGDVDATVLCRQLGYAKGKGVKGAHFGRGKGPVWLDNLQCKGNESRLQDCRHNSFAVQNCNHGEDAGVYCTGIRQSSTEAPSEEASRFKPVYKEEGDTVIIAVTASIISVLMLVIAIGGYVLYRKTRPKNEIEKVLVHNDMNDPNPQPPQPTDGRVTLSKLKAHFSKPKLNESEEAPDGQGVTNPVYQDERNTQGVIMEESAIEQPGTVGFEI